MGVFVPFWQGGLNLRLVALVVPIQPFAYVVANYTCHDRNNESNKYIHRKVRAPSLCRYRGGNKIKYTISSFKARWKAERKGPPFKSSKWLGICPFRRRYDNSKKIFFGSCFGSHKKEEYKIWYADMFNYIIQLYQKRLVSECDNGRLSLS